MTRLLLLSRASLSCLPREPSSSIRWRYLSTRPKLAGPSSRKENKTGKGDTSVTTEAKPDNGRPNGQYSDSTSAVRGPLVSDSSLAPNIEDDTPIADDVHEFDTHALVSRLNSGGLPQGQASAFMEAIRALLGRSIENARHIFLSKGELENESYLFRAAMSELRNEISTIRKNETAALRVETSTLRRDVDLLNQLIREETSDLKNQIEIEVGDRKSTLRAEQKTMEIRIQELNNKIIVQILSDLRSDIEKVRWQTTRRGLSKCVLTWWY